MKALLFNVSALIALVPAAVFDHAALVFAPSASAADVGQGTDEVTIRFLQNQPVSRWEYGIYTLQLDLDATQWAGMPEITHGRTTVREMRDSAPPHRATGLLIFIDINEDLDEDFCRKAINEVRERAGVKNGKLIPEREKSGRGSYYAEFFSPPHGPAAGYGPRVDRLISIEVKTSWIRCHGPLLSTKVTASE